MDINEIKQLIPHRYPFLLIDRITHVDEQRVEGWKNVTVNEPFFTGHFPDHPIMPGVLIVEALAQTCGVMLAQRTPELSRGLPLFLGIEQARFRKPVRPGDVLRLTGEVVAHKGNIWKCAGRAFVAEELVCEATLLVGFKPQAK